MNFNSASRKTIRTNPRGNSKKFKVDFYSDFGQLKYVFAELVTKTEIKNEDQQAEIDDTQKLQKKKTKDACHSVHVI